LPDIQRYKQGCDNPCADGAFNLNEIMAKASDQQPIVDKEPGYKDNLLYIYTSGTTGLPKAALFPNSRCVKLLLIV
jgi:acyl-coenzyme A synthetase/AMP-(fatty) acid ligase